MERTQIYLSREQASVLAREAKRRGTTRSHLIREAIAERYGGTRDRATTESALRASAGAWAGRRDDGEAYVEKLRTGRRWRDLYGDESADEHAASE